ncbi:hypothetical protein QFZ22_004718 [Streptomyces canus]|uniref:Uncharacterized protein n=1 Tax=Streptomyces canus TaxID=58343 RepID=A0AAW8FGT9_9ACTN|nr:hypothetical protein [Streptomyces canus]
MSALAFSQKSAHRSAALGAERAASSRSRTRHDREPRNAPPTLHSSQPHPAQTTDQSSGSARQPLAHRAEPVRESRAIASNSATPHPADVLASAAGRR